MVETINKLIRVSRQLLQELGREPSPEEIAKEMNMPVERVREILKISQEPVSLRLQSVRRRIHILVISSRMIMYWFRLMRQHSHFLKSSLRRCLALLQRESRRYSHSALA